LDSACLQIEQAQFILPTVLGFEKIKSSSGNCRCRSPDLMTPNNQYIERATPIIIRIKLNKAKRRVNKNTPNMIIANPRTRIQRSRIDALEPNTTIVVIFIRASSSEVVIAVGVNAIITQTCQDTSVF
jgi:hypothetical protein